MPNLRLLISGYLLFCLLQPLAAEETIRYYDIELLVFENLDESIENKEVWPEGKQLEAPENATILGQKFSGQLPPEYNQKYLFKILPLADFQLTEEAETLKTSEKYRILMHTGWRQPGLAREVAIPVQFSHIISDEAPGIEETAETGTAVQAAQSPQALQTAEVPADVTAMTNKAKLQGLITIVLSRYLHLDVEMLYQKQDQPGYVDMYDTSFLEGRTDQEPIYYLKQTRRMRSQETHYIDHPKFSMLVRITPFKVETPAETPGLPKKG